MNHFCKKALVVAVSVLLAFSAAACTDPTGGETERIDTTKTQLYVYNFYGGYGSDWLAAAKERYEELHKDDVYEEGKKGVQIFINNQKKSMMEVVASQVLDNVDEVYFSEYSYYYTLKNLGILGDITDAVTKPLTEYGETRSVEDKLTDEQKAYYGIEENGTVHYYGLPHYAGYSGTLIYNVDLFEKEGYYFAETPSDNTAEGRFIDRFNTEKSAGPDGVKGTSDDGLPTTYEEFFLLCDFIKEGGATPLTWNGQYYRQYLNNVAQALVADHEGLEEMMLNYTLNGTSNTLATVQNGIVTRQGPTEITNENGYLLTQQEGKYYALSFLEKLIKTDDYHNRLAFNNSYTHIDAQNDFLYAGHDGTTKDAALLCDGIWWEMEAKDTFASMEASMGPDYSKYSRNFGVFPFPKATAERAAEAAASEKPYTLYDDIFSICFMKANIAEWKKPLALDFIRFVNTDESLVEFTTITNTLKALDYTLDDAAKAKLTAFGRSLVEIREKSDIVYPFSTNPLYMNNQEFFSTHEAFYTSQDQWSPSAMHEANITAEQHFANMLAYSRGKWSTLN